MLHLPIERMAELVDGGASADERAHLDACVTCTREFEAYRRLVVLASDERRRIAPPLTDWETLGARLRAEGLMASAGQASAPGPRARVAITELLRRAAVVVIFVGGGAVLGRMSAGIPITDAVAFRPDSAFGAGTVAASGGVPVMAVNNSVGGFSTQDEAVRALESAQRQYEVAATWLSSHDTSSSALAPDQYRTRLAALDRTAETMQQAMRDAPTDPYINQYYLSTLSAREQTLRRLGTTLPVGRKLGRF
ncbi:MAG: hypothetical protein ABI910_09870 [Gemmatimonadota bacterium]